MGEIKDCLYPAGNHQAVVIISTAFFWALGGKTEKYHLEMLICFVYYEIGLWCNVFIYDEIGAYLSMNGKHCLLLQNSENRRVFCRLY